MTKRLSLSLASASAAALFGGERPALAQDRTFTVSWWGFNGDALQEIIIDPFQEMCSCEVVFETGKQRRPSQPPAIARRRRGGRDLPDRPFLAAGDRPGPVPAGRPRARCPTSRRSTTSRRPRRASMARPTPSAASASSTTPTRSPSRSHHGTICGGKTSPRRCRCPASPPPRARWSCCAPPRRSGWTPMPTPTRPLPKSPVSFPTS